MNECNIFGRVDRQAQDRMDRTGIGIMKSGLSGSCIALIYLNRFGRDKEYILRNPFPICRDIRYGLKEGS